MPANPPCAVAILLCTCAGALGQAGSLDPSFGAGGVSVYGPLPNARFTALAVQPDGSVLAAGDTGLSASTAVVRFRAPDGLPDPAFSGGAAVFDMDPYTETPVDMAVLPDGRILVLGDEFGLMVARLNANGTVDKSFGTKGLAAAPAGRFWYAAAIAPVPPGAPGAGRLVIAAASHPKNGATSWDTTLVRYTADGAIDSTFGGGKSKGYVVHSYSPGEDNPARGCLLVQPDGRIVLAGRAYSAETQAFHGFVARYNADGSHDASFAGGGVAVLPAGAGFGYPRGLALAPDGRIVVTWNSGPRIGLARFLSNGVPDPDFGQSGWTHHDAGLHAESGYDAVALLADGRIVVGGRVYDPATERNSMAAWRFDETGAPDLSFGVAGAAEPTYIPAAAGEIGWGGVGIDPAGRIVVAGYVYGLGGGTKYPAVARWLAD